MRAPINSTKHYVQVSLSTAAAGARNTETIINAKSLSLVTASANDVRAGAIIKAVWLEFWLRGETNQGAEQLAVVKTEGNGSSPTFIEMGNFMDYQNKKNCLFFHQGLSTDSNTMPIPVVRGWFKIPKSKQRFGLGDKLSVTISGLALAVEYCGFATFKEYY